MKYHKFREVLAVAPWVWYHIGSPMLNSAPLNHSRGEATRLLRHYVRHHLEYIAFRPLESLDLNSKVESRRGDDGTAMATTYWVRLHIGGVDQPFERLRCVQRSANLGEDDETTIRGVLAHLQQWHQDAWSKKGKALHIDAILKETKVRRCTGHHTQTIEVYLTPEGLVV